MLLFLFMLLLWLLFLLFIILNDSFYWKINAVVCASMCCFFYRNIFELKQFYLTYLLTTRQSTLQQNHFALHSPHHRRVRWFYFWFLLGLAFSLAWLYLPLFADYIHSNCLLCLWVTIYLIDFIRIPPPPALSFHFILFQPAILPFTK